jgi:HEPN domain-containing protein
MKNSRQEADRWFNQAVFDLDEAKGSLERKSFAYACFFAEQAAQKFVKSFLIARGERFVPLHSIRDLLSKAAGYDPSLESLVLDGQKLDRYYLITRYPDALPSPNIPYKSYGREEAAEALGITERIEKAIISANKNPH